MSYEIASGQGELIFVAIQSDKDVLNFPTSSGTIFLTEPPTFSQEPTVVKNDEMRDSYAEQKSKIAGFKMGSLKLAGNFKVSGTPGALSPIHPLLLAAYGRHTVTSNTKVEYMHYRRSTEDPFIYLTVLIKKQAETVLLKNVRVKKFDTDIQADKNLPLSCDCMYEYQYIAGKSTLKNAIDGTVTPVTTIPLNGLEDYQLFTVGCYIYVGTDDNSGEGFEVTEVSKAANTLTIAGGVTTEQAQAAKIGGFVPTAVISGNNIVTSKSWMNAITGELGSQKIYLTQVKFGLENGTKALENIMSDTGVKGFSEGSRKATFSVQKYFSLFGENARYLHENAVEVPLDVQVGSESGSIVKIVIPCWIVNKQNESGKEEKALSIDGQCFEDSGDDESTLVLM